MAADYWNSTQRRHWLFAPSQLSQMRAKLDATNSLMTSQHPLPDTRLISIYLRDQLHKLSRRLPTRQPVLATTLLYLSRYWLLRPIRTTNPYLLLATSFYLASKTEELPHHIRLVLTEAKNLWPEFIPSDPARLGEAEFGMISELNSQLIIFHPYRTVVELSGRELTTAGNAGMGNGSNGNGNGTLSGNGYGSGGNERGSNLGMGVNISHGFSSNSQASHQGSFGMSNETNGNNNEPSQAKKWNLNLTQEETATAWSIVNDSYLTDLPLTCPPHIIAIMAIFLAVICQPSRLPGLNLHSITGQQQQMQQNQRQLNSSSLSSSSDGAGITGPSPMHALPPRPGTYNQYASSLGGSRGLAAAMRDSATSAATATSNNSSNASAAYANSNTNMTANSQASPTPQSRAHSERIEKLIVFLAESEISIEKVAEASQELISLYEVWEGYSEKAVKESISRYMRARGLDK